jgi:hypothetical protein
VVDSLFSTADASLILSINSQFLDELIHTLGIEREKTQFPLRRLL